MEEHSNTVLLASFISKDQVTKSLELLKDNFKVFNDRVYVLNNKSDKTQLILTYNIITDGGKVEFRSVLKNTISIHRKKATNTLYTINALNVIIKQTGSRDIEWENYENYLLLTQDIEDGEKDLVTVKTSLNNIIQLNEDISADKSED